MSFYTSSSGPSYWFKERTSIVASSTFNTVSLPVSTFKTVKYIMSFWNTTQGKTKSMDMLVNNENPDFNSAVGNKLGSLNVTVNETLSGSDMYLEITNNESYTVELDLAYIVLGGA